MQTNATSITIYRVENLVNGKAYVGQTKTSVGKRLNQHWYSAKRGISNPFHKAMRKYGRDAFTIKPVLICDESMANYYEHAVLGMYGCYAHNKAGYNVANPLNHFSSINDAKGEKHPMARLKADDILEIRGAVDLSHSDIAKKYGIVYGTVKHIRSGKAWASVGGVRHFSEYKKDVHSGESHHASVISDDVRAAIKADTTTNSTLLAKKYNVHKSLIGVIRGAQPQISKLRVIPDSVAQFVLDNPEIPHVKLGKQLSISEATISRIKAGKQFGHLKSNASNDQWKLFFKRQQHSTGKLRS